MLSFDEHSGIISFLGGIVVLVMASVGLSLLTDMRLKTSSSVVKIENEIAMANLELERLSAAHAEQSGLLNDAGSSSGLVALEVILGNLKTLRERNSSLEQEVKKLRASIIELDDEFSRYREEFRRKMWTAAIGEPLGDLVIRGGREYKQATITRVTEVGLEIRHQDGIARIQAPDLDRGTQDRFQWDDEERRKLLKQELKSLLDSAGALTDGSQAAQRNPEPPARTLSPSQRKQSVVDPEEMTRLRRQVTGWQSKVSQLSSEKEDAELRLGYGNQVSIPGSLETWNARVKRLGEELSRARGELAVAKARLATASGD